jgi:hypothetical protein
MRPSITVRKCRVRDAVFWRVRWREAGKIRRKFFRSESKAEVLAASLRGEAVAVKKQLAALAEPDQEKLVMVFKEAQRRGLDLLALLSPTVAAAPGSPAAQAVLEEMLLAKTNAGRDKDYLKSLAGIVNGFLRGRERLAVNQFTAADVEIFLASKKIGYWPTLRSRLSTYFKFAMRRKYRPDNPCAALETITTLQSSPEIFTPAEAATCLKFLHRHAGAKFLPHKVKDGLKKIPAHPGLTWFLLTTFCGLRPEEAGLIKPENLFLEPKAESKKQKGETDFKPHIEVRAEICKTGQWRIVYPPAEVVRALRWSLKNGSAVPFAATSKKKLLRRLRSLLGWPRWKHDVTRHSASSYWLALTNDARHVAEMLGHSEATARKKYKKPVERATAEKFYGSLQLLLAKIDVKKPTAPHSRPHQWM